MKNTRALIIIAKHPDKESVKTRLSGTMTDEERLRLYTYLLRRTLKRLGCIRGIDTYIAFAPGNATGFFSAFGLSLIPLPAGDLGLRMFHAFREVFSRGYRMAALVGVDIPDLTAQTVRTAFEMLDKSDVVFGPARDGGYYLIGMKKPHRELFYGIPLSSSETLQRSVEKSEQRGFSVALTEELSDIDTIEDVKKAGFITE